ncbi:MAG: phosphatidylserine decarboxylase family protein [Bacteroidales bacterium]|nr:phosphatidylserine decarboxylase family protein [Bacteroidales bacterium]
MKGFKLITIDKDSHGTIAKAWAVIAAIAAVVVLLVHNPWIEAVLLIILILFAFFVFWFHRVPDREIPEGDVRSVTSVADGKVVIVERVYEGEYFKDDRIMVTIYMDFFDVHANFWPVSGEVSYYRYHPGRYLLAFLPKSSEKNEHSSTAVRNDCGEIFFKQIAGTFARRIVCYSEEGLSVDRGKQCGIIKFGSRIDLFLPLDAEILVKEGDFVKGRTSLIARLS